MQRILALIVLVLFLTNPLKAEDSIPITSKNEKTTFLKNLSPSSLSISPFYTKLKGEEQFANWKAFDPGVRFSLYPTKPSFLFVYMDAFWEIYRETNFERMGPPTVFKENYPVIQGGVGLSGVVPLKWGIGIDGEVTYDIVNAICKGEHLPDMAVGISWENEKETWGFGFLNITKLEYSSFFNPCFYVTRNFELKRKRRMH